MHACICVNMHICLHVYTCICVYVYLYICMIGIKRSVHVYMYIVHQEVLVCFSSIFSSACLYLSLRPLFDLIWKNINPAPYIIVFQLGPCSILNHPKPRTGICCSIRFKYSLKIWDVFNPGIILVESLLAPRTNPVTPKLEIEKMSFRLDHRRGCCERARNVKTSHKMMVVWWLSSNTWVRPSSMPV